MIAMIALSSVASYNDSNDCFHKCFKRKTLEHLVSSALLYYEQVYRTCHSLLRPPDPPKFLLEPLKVRGGGLIGLVSTVRSITVYKS